MNLTLSKVKISLVMGIFLSLIVFLIMQLQNHFSELIKLKKQAYENEMLTSILKQVDSKSEYNLQKIILTADFKPDLNHIKINRLYKANKQNELQGYIIEAQTYEGYSGLIRFLAYLNLNNQLLGFAILEHKETPGLGDKIDLRKTNWIKQFFLKKYEPSTWQLTKYGGQFDQISGATISSSAILNSMRDILDKNLPNLLIK